MSVEINELLVRVEVADRQQGSGGSQTPTAPPNPQQREALIAECVERVMELLRQQEER